MLLMPRMTVAAAGVLLFAAPHLAAQSRSPTLGQPISWQVYHSGEPPVVVGTILNFLGHPESNVRVSIPAAGLSALTDHNGRFTLAPPSSGNWTLHVGFGSTLVTAELTVPSQSRVVVAALLSDQPSLCQNICIGPCDDLRILVIDSIANTSPRGDATVRLEHPSATIVNRVDLRADERLTLVSVGTGRKVETAGYHRIEISVPGYQLWRKEEVWLEQIPRCHGILLGREHVARLVRNRP